MVVDKSSSGFVKDRYGMNAQKEIQFFSVQNAIQISLTNFNLFLNFNGLVLQYMYLIGKRKCTKKKKKSTKRWN